MQHVSSSKTHEKTGTKKMRNKKEKEVGTIRGTIATIRETQNQNATNRSYARQLSKTRSRPIANKNVEKGKARQ